MEKHSFLWKARSAVYDHFNTHKVQLSINPKRWLPSLFWCVCKYALFYLPIQRRTLCCLCPQWSTLARKLKMYICSLSTWITCLCPYPFLLNILKNLRSWYTYRHLVVKKKYIICSTVGKNWELPILMRFLIKSFDLSWRAN